ARNHFWYFPRNKVFAMILASLNRHSENQISSICIQRLQGLMEGGITVMRILLIVAAIVGLSESGSAQTAAPKTAGTTLGQEATGHLGQTVDGALQFYYGDERT